MPGGLDIVGVRTAIDIDHRRISLIGIEVCGFHHSVIEVGHSIRSLDAAALKDGILVTSPRVFSIQ